VLECDRTGQRLSNGTRPKTCRAVVGLVRTVNYGFDGVTDPIVLRFFVSIFFLGFYILAEIPTHDRYQIRAVVRKG